MNLYAKLLQREEAGKPITVGLIGCPCRKLNPDVWVMQSAQDWHRQNTADGLDRAGYRRILIQG